MNIITKYLEYLKDNPEGFWFKRKLYGWGWTPAKPQGWAVLGVYVGALVMLIARLDPEAELAEMVWPFFIPLGILTALLLLITYLTGEKPRWQWGESIKDDK